MVEWNVVWGKLIMEYDCDFIVIYYMYVVEVKLFCLVVIFLIDG